MWKNLGTKPSTPEDSTELVQLLGNGPAWGSVLRSHGELDKFCL
jgi:hypothetical protein